MVHEFHLCKYIVHIAVREERLPPPPADRWTDLPELTPLRAQHGCGLVELGGRRGVIVVGGDSGGTRLSDVRYVASPTSNCHIQPTSSNSS